MSEDILVYVIQSGREEKKKRKQAEGKEGAKEARSEWKKAVPRGFGSPQTRTRQVCVSDVQLGVWCVRIAGAMLCGTMGRSAR